jgi:hypothetical protein
MHSFFSQIPHWVSAKYHRMETNGAGLGSLKAHGLLGASPYTLIIILALAVHCSSCQGRKT